MQDVLNSMIEKLSDEDKEIFSQLAKKLEKFDGDVSKFSDSERALIAKMESKYSDDLSTASTANTQSTINVGGILASGFAGFVRQQLAKYLREQYPNEEDAVRYAFNNKWLPNELRESSTASKIFLDFQEDICEANQWREEVVGIESDKSMAVGMTWFMVIYQLNLALN